ncbi:MAG TPA: acetolactate synthase large subunit, partial [Methanomassiliicoccales archaeon]|nr:acetolactate synthase large subunit [Methanomassiliicoccales archaeon]
ELMDALSDTDIKFIITRHEQSAAFITGIQGRLTGEPQVCLSTLGPGATNLVTGVADAYLGGMPMIAITAQAGLERTTPPTKQVLDLAALFRPITKDSVSIRSGNNIPLLFRRAFDLARQERPGPVHIEMPEDVMRTESSGMPIARCEVETVRPDKRSMLQIAEMLSESSRPLIIAGNGVVRSGAVQQMRDLSSRWNIPVIHTWWGAGIVSYDDKNSLNTTGVRASDNAREAYARADLIILAGFDLIEFQPQYWNIGGKKEILYLGDCPMGQSEHVHPDVQVVGSLRHVLKTLSELGQLKEDWCQDIRSRVHMLIELDLTESKGVRPQNAIRILSKRMGKQDVVVSDVGAHLIWLAKYYPVYRENTLLLDNGLISMGVGVPWAIGAKTVRPESKVVAVCGDGSFMMTMAELATAKEHGLNFITMIFNDGGYGLIKLKMERSCGRSSNTQLLAPDFVKLADAFGAEGYRVSTSYELDQVLGDCLDRDALAVIDVKIDYDDNRSLIG